MWAVGLSALLIISISSNNSIQPKLAIADDQDVKDAVPEIAVAPSTPSFGTPINVSNNAGNSHNQELAISGNNVYLVWVDDSSGNNEIFFSVSTNNGASFNAPVNLSKNDGNSIQPQIAAFGNNVYLVWVDDTGSSFGAPDVFFTASTNNGASFSAPINLSNEAGTNSFNPQIAASGSDVYVAWSDYTGTGNFAGAQLFFRVSHDNGVSFNPLVQLTPSTGATAIAPPEIHMVSDGNNIYLVYTQNFFGLFGCCVNTPFTMSDNNGFTFSTPITPIAGGGAGQNPQIAVSGNNVYVVHQERFPGAIDVFFAASTDNGVSFGTPINLSNNGASILPQIAASGSDIYVIWNNSTPENKDIFFTASTNSGVSFTTPINLSNDSGNSVSPQIAASGSNVYLVWQDDTAGNTEIFFAASTDNGTSFGSALNLSSNTGFSEHPEMVVSVNNVYAVWDNSGNAGNPDIFFIGNTTRSTSGLIDTHKFTKIIKDAERRTVATVTGEVRVSGNVMPIKNVQTPYTVEIIIDNPQSAWLTEGKLHVAYDDAIGEWNTGPREWVFNRATSEWTEVHPTKPIVKIFAQAVLWILELVPIFGQAIGAADQVATVASILGSESSGDPVLDDNKFDIKTVKLYSNLSAKNTKYKVEFLLTFTGQPAHKLHIFVDKMTIFKKDSLGTPWSTTISDSFEIPITVIG